jgi:hypothetical protein
MSDCVCLGKRAQKMEVFLGSVTLNMGPGRGEMCLPDVSACPAVHYASSP